MSRLKQLLHESRKWFEKLLDAIEEHIKFVESIVETVHNPLIILDGDLRVISANKAFYKLFQVSVLETENRKIYDLGNHQWDIPKLRELLEEIIIKNTAIEAFEVKHDFKHLGKRIMILNARRIYKDEKKTDKILLAIEDITEQRKLEQEIKESRNWLFTTLNSIGDAVIATDKRGIVQFMNPIAENLTGWTQTEAKGKLLNTIFKIINQRSRTPVENPIERVLREGIVVGLANHTLLISREGKEIPIDDSGAPIINERGEIIGVVLIFRDVTERRQMNELNRNLAAIVESSDDAIISISMEGMIKSWNSSASQIFGYTEEEICGTSILSLIAPEFLKAFLLHFEKIKDGDHINHFETVWKKANGELIHISLTISPLEDESGIITGVSLIARDITERKKMIEKLKQSEMQYQEAYNQAQVYKDLLSHDMSNILQSVLLGAQLCMRDLGDRGKFEDLKTILSTIEIEINRGAHLINTIHKFTRLEEGKVTLIKYEIISVLKTIVHFISDTYRKKVINIHIDSDKKELFIQGNEFFEDLVQNLLLNLINLDSISKNAIMRIDIRVSEMLKNGIPYVKIEFITYELEIDDLQERTIFQLGYKNGKRLNVGDFGLSLVKKILDLYQGQITIERQVYEDGAKGTNFIIIIPQVC
ncbi:MAG: PAS domain S-box protein [Candidatus Helarchaeota archaeon]